MGLVRVRVRPDYRYRFARVSGRQFHKGGEVYAEGYLDEEIRTSPLLEIEPVEVADEVLATDAARELAGAEGVDLRQVVGSGVDGRVVVADVREEIASSQAPRNDGDEEVVE